MTEVKQTRCKRKRDDDVIVIENGNTAAVL
jgi:hypothetical protein